MIKTIPYFILVIIISILFTNCEQDEIRITTEQLHNKIKVQKLNAQDIPEIMDFLHTNTKKVFTKNYKSTNNYNYGDLDFDEIAHVIDTLENGNYTFRINNVKEVFGAGVNIYNLIIHTDENGNPETPYIIKYELDANFAVDYYSGAKDFSAFKGAMSFYSIDTFFNAHEFNTKNDDLPCPRIVVDNPSGSDPNDNGDTNGGGQAENGNPVGDSGFGDPGDSSPADAGGLDITIVIFNNPSSGTCTKWEWQPVVDILDENGNVENTLGNWVCIETSQKSLSTKNDNDCPDPNGPIGVLPGLPKETDPMKICEQLNKLLTTTKTKDALDKLQTSARNNKEDEEGYEISKDANDAITTKFKQGGFRGVELDAGGDIIASMHMHTPNGNPMFSGQDIYNMFTMYSNGQLNNTNNSTVYNTTSILVVNINGSVQTFAITINNINYLRYILAKIDKNSKGNELDAELQNKYNNTINGTNANAYMQDLLKYMNSLTPNSPAINLHKLNAAGTAFEKVTLDANDNNNPKTSPCQ